MTKPPKRMWIRVHKYSIQNASGKMRLVLHVAKRNVWQTYMAWYRFDHHPPKCHQVQDQRHCTQSRKGKRGRLAHWPPCGRYETWSCLKMRERESARKKENKDKSTFYRWENFNAAYCATYLPVCFSLLTWHPIPFVYTSLPTRNTLHVMSIRALLKRVHQLPDPSY